MTLLSDDDHPGPRCSCGDCLLTYRADEVLFEQDSAPLITITSYERKRNLDKPSTPVDPMLADVAAALEELADSGFFHVVPCDLLHAETLMRDLNYSLKQLCVENRDGSYATQADRQHLLDLVADKLHELGFRHMDAKSLKPKHVEALVASWLAEGLSPGTLKNRMSALRW